MGETAPLTPPPPSVGRAATAALEASRRLLTGPDRRKRWGALTILAAMAGFVGAGATPPPMGLLQPLWQDRALHHTVFDNGGVIAVLLFLALFLIVMGGLGRSFTLGFLEGLVSEAPDPRSYRRNLRAGVAHFAWSSAMSIPLYLLLFGGEALIARDTLEQITRLLGVPSTTDAELLGLVLSAGFKFLLVLIPWTIATLPVMVMVYELVPAVMVLSTLGPVPAFRRILALATKLPRPFALYVALRYVLQLIGNLAALLAFLPCLLVSSPIVAVFLVGGWQLSRRLGGLGNPGGAAALTVGVLFAAVGLYCTLCTALLPVSVYINNFALQFVFQLDPNREHVNRLLPLAPQTDH